jgi:hypothetical protein
MMMGEITTVKTTIIFSPASTTFSMKPKMKYFNTGPKKYIENRESGREKDWFEGFI